MVLATTAFSQTLKIGGAEVVAGALSELEVPIPPEWKKIVARTPGGAAVEKAKVGIVLPRDFDPARSWPVWVVNVTSSGEAQPIGALRGIRESLLAKGWVGIAAEGPFKPNPDSTEWYLAMLSSALAATHTAWPESRKWPYACGGFSGGAKRSGGVAASLAKSGYNVIGMFMAGCNEDAASTGLSSSKPAAATFKKVPIFLSSGAEDKVATPAQHATVKASMERTGFKDVRLEGHPGAHKLHKEHVDAAMAWFLEVAAKAPAAPGAAAAGPKSSFDDFFKKK